MNDIGHCFSKAGQLMPISLSRMLFTAKECLLPDKQWDFSGYEKYVNCVRESMSRLVEDIYSHIL